MNPLAQPRKWPKLELSRWQIVQLSMLSLLIAAMAVWKFQYEQILPKSTSVQMMFKQTSALNEQSFAKTTAPHTKTVKAQL